MRDKTFIPQDYDVFAELDVDKKSISVTFTNHQGFIRSLRMPYSVEHLVNHVRRGKRGQATFVISSTKKLECPCYVSLTA